MDPKKGTLYSSVEEAKKAGVQNPVEITGQISDIERISNLIKKEFTKEQKKAQHKKNKDARAARRHNR